MPKTVVDIVQSIETIGQYDSYVANKHENRVAITDTIHRNKFLLFGTSLTSRTKKKTHLSFLKSDCNLFARSYIACQSREGNLEDFFRDEKPSSPPSMSSMGKRSITQKSEILHCLEIYTAYDSPDVDINVIDGPVLVNMLPPEKAKTFNKTDVFLSYIVNQASTVRRLDIVWD